jgi:hypothetical protein
MNMAGRRCETRVTPGRYLKVGQGRIAEHCLSPRTGMTAIARSLRLSANEGAEPLAFQAKESSDSLYQTG